MVVQFFQENVSLKLDDTLCPFGIKRKNENAHINHEEDYPK